MKSPVVCFLTIILTVFLLTITLMFRDRFLYFLLGYDPEITSTTSVASFKAHAAIQKWRLILLGLTFLLGIVSVIICAKNEKIATGSWLYTAGKFIGIVATVIVIVILIIFIILPKRLL